MKKTLLKETIRNIKKNLMSWIAIAVVTMIGCGVYCGVFFYAEAMEKNAQAFFLQANYEDYDIVALQGASEDEIASLLEVEGIQDVEGTIEISGSEVLIDGQTLEATILEAPERIGKSILTGGREPAAENECALTDQNLEDNGIQIGDTIEVIPSSATLFGDILKTREFTVTGTVQCPEDIITSQKVFVVLPPAAFDQDKTLGYYTNVLVKADLPAGVNPFSKAYSSATQKISDTLNAKLTEIGKADRSDRQQKAQEILDEKRADAEGELQNARETIAEKEQEIHDGEEMLQKLETQVDSGEDPFAEAEAQIEDGKNQIAEAEKQLSSAKRQLSAGEADLREKEKQLQLMEANVGPVPEMEAELNNAKQTLKKNKAALAQKEAELNEKKEELANAESELAEKKQEFAEAAKDLPQKRKELEEGKEKLSEAKDEYRQKEEEVNKQFSDAQEMIDGLQEASFLLMNREDKGTTTLYSQFVEILRKLATIFVVIFMAIGVVVVLSTITILIDNQKKLIGAMKAFGFRNGEIISKYTIFGLSAVCFGMVLTVGLSWVLEKIVYRVMGGMFNIRTVSFTFHLPAYLILFLIEVLLAVGVATLTTWYNAVRSSAIDLMNGDTLEKKHRKGVRIKLERSLYSRLIFRNIKNDLARVVCSEIIIGGSCLMIGVGFTLYFAFEQMMPLSAKEVNHYQLEISLEEGEDDALLQEVEQKLTEEDISFEEITERGSVFRVGEDSFFANVLSADPEVFSDYFDIRDMEGKTQYLADGDGVLIPNRVAERFGIEEGETLSVADSHLLLQELPINGIYRCYYGRDLFMNREVYASLFGEDATPTSLFVRTANPISLTYKLSNEFPSLVITSTSEIPQGLSGMRKLFQTLVFVMTALSIIMSIFVLLNLVNIFVGRRKNEIIIMGVNGFSYRERIGYLLRETIATTVIGLLLGTVMGCFLSDYLIRLVEGSDTMFRRGIIPGAWVLACVLETVFALLINFFAFRRVKKYELTELTR